MRSVPRPKLALMKRAPHPYRAAVQPLKFREHLAKNRLAELDDWVTEAARRRSVSRVSITALALYGVALMVLLSVLAAIYYIALGLLVLSAPEVGWVRGTERTEIATGSCHLAGLCRWPAHRQRERRK
jgi:hypothetical protein